LAWDKVAWRQCTTPATIKQYDIHPWKEDNMTLANQIEAIECSMHDIERDIVRMKGQITVKNKEECDAEIFVMTKWHNELRAAVATIKRVQETVNFFYSLFKDWDK
jgi:hypothetical protein